MSLLKILPSVAVLAFVFLREVYTNWTNQTSALSQFYHPIINIFDAQWLGFDAFKIPNEILVLPP